MNFAILLFPLVVILLMLIVLRVTIRVLIRQKNKILSQKLQILYDERKIAELTETILQRLDYFENLMKNHHDYIVIGHKPIMLTFQSEPVLSIESIRPGHIHSKVATPEPLIFSFESVGYTNEMIARRVAEYLLQHNYVSAIYDAKAGQIRVRLNVIKV